MSPTGFTAEQLAGLPGMPSTARRVRAKALTEGWPSAVEAVRGGRRYLYPKAALPAATQVALARAEALHMTPVLDGELTESQRVAIAERLPLVSAVFERVVEGVSVDQAIDAVRAAHDAPPSARTIRRWFDAVREAELEEWPARLAPAWRPGNAASAECHPDAWAFFRDDFLRESKPAAAACYRRMTAVARVNGWTPIPSQRALERRLEREVSPEVLLLRRGGVRALERALPSQRRDRSHLGVLEAVTGDGHLADVFVRWPDGSVGRPMLVGFQDLRTGKILSWRCDRSENVELVRLAFADVVNDWGVPRRAYFDNGRSWASKALSGGAKTRFRGKILAEDPTGLFVMLGVELHWTTPYHGQAKPIERAWRDFCENIARHPTFDRAYTGSDPTRRPESTSEKHAVPLETFLSVVATEVTLHNALEGRAAIGGRSFDALFAELYAQGPIRRATEEQQRALWLSMSQVTVRSRECEIVLWDTRFANFPVLMPLRGKKVTVRFDPENLGRGLYVYRQDGSYAGYVAPTSRVAFDDVHAAKAHAKAKRDIVRAVKKASAAQQTFATHTLGAMHLAATGATERLETKVVEPVFGRKVPVVPTVVEIAPTAGELAAEGALEEHVTAAGRRAANSLEQHAEDLRDELGSRALALLAGERR